MNANINTLNIIYTHRDRNKRYMCTHELVYMHIFPNSVHLRGPRSYDTPLTMNTASTQTLVSK